MRVIISGGGSGGHVYPAIAIATEIQTRQPDAEILFIGAKGKLEMDKVPAAGFRIEGLDVMGIQRKLTLRNLQFPFKLIGSLIRARKVISDFRPDIAIGVGGYASGPALYAAAGMDVPTLIQEQNSYPGITNKMLANQVDRICVAYEGMDRFFPGDKIVQTGNPVRRGLQNLADKREMGMRHFGLGPDKKTIFLFGGSLGARTLNEAMRAATSQLSELDDIQVLWQLGKLYADEFANCATARLPHVRPTAFIDRMDLAYACADVIVCRAGAMTISELCVVGKAAVLVPSPNVAEDHQSRNAEALQKHGAALLIRDTDVRERGIAEAIGLIHDDDIRGRMEAAIAKLAKPEALAAIWDEIAKLVR